MAIYIETYIPDRQFFFFLHIFGILMLMLYLATSTRHIMGLPSYDVVGIISAELFWTMIETGVAVIAACLPTLRPLSFLSTFGATFSGLRSFISFRSGTGQSKGDLELDDSKQTSFEASGTKGENKTTNSSVIDGFPTQDDSYV